MRVSCLNTCLPENDENSAKLFDESKRKHLVEVVSGKLIALAKECEKPLAHSTKGKKIKN